MNRFLTLLSCLYCISSYAAISFTENVIRGGSYHSVHAGDIDSDGDMDLVTIFNSGDSVSWFKNNGNGAFTEFTVISRTGLGARDAKIVDLNQDNKVDIVIVSDSETSIYWYRNNGTEIFTEELLYNNFSLYNTIQIADMDNDNDFDLVTSSFGFIGTNDEVNYYQNDGGERFDELELFSSNSPTSNAFPVKISSNTMVDIIYANAHSSSVKHFQHSTIPTDATILTSFNENPTPVSGTVNGIRGLFAIDMDDDNDMDILTASQTDNSIRWHQNNNGSFTQHLVHGSALGAYSVHAADFDNDNDIDITAASFDDGSVWVYENNGSNSFSVLRLEFDITTTSATESIAVKINNDNFLDIVSASSSGLRWHKQTVIIIDPIFENGFE
jgi:hypothetical protein